MNREYISLIYLMKVKTLFPIHFIEYNGQAVGIQSQYRLIFRNISIIITSSIKSFYKNFIFHIEILTEIHCMYFQIVSSVHYLRYFALFPLCFSINFHNARALCSAFIQRQDICFVVSLSTIGKSKYTPQYSHKMTFYV